MDLLTLFDVFDGAHGVVVHDFFGLISVWNGGSTVNIYDPFGRCVDCWTGHEMDHQSFQRQAIEHVETGAGYGGDNETS